MSSFTPSPLDDLKALILLLQRIRAEVSREDIEALQRKAIDAGDTRLADWCRDALGGDLPSWDACGVLILEQRGVPILEQRHQ
jgi:hypothetical protein